MIVDTNVHLSRWPCRRLPDDETPRLVARLKQHGVHEAWAGSFEGILHKDLDGVNRRLAQECTEHGEGLLIPFGEINPLLPDWRDDLRRCRETYKMPGVRLHPNYHGYGLDAPEFAELLAAAADLDLIVQIVVAMEDERTQHRLLRVPLVDLTQLPAKIAAHPRARLVVLNGLRGAPADSLARIADAGQVYFDLALLEGVGGVERALKTFPLERLLFGSHAPYFYFDAALLKLQESELANFQREAISFRNADRLIRRRP